MNKIKRIINVLEVTRILEELEECDSFHNRCDYLLNYSEIDCLLEYIEDLQQRLDKAIEYIENNTYDDSLDGDGSRLMFEKANGKDLLEILKGKEKE